MSPEDRAVMAAHQADADAHFATLPPEATCVLPLGALTPLPERRRWDGRPDHLFHALTQVRRKGWQEGMPSPLDGITPVPGCACALCTGVAPRPTIPFPQRETLDVGAARAVPLLDVLSLLRINAGRRVGRTYRVACPVHRGEGPNCSVDPAKGLWKCFVCGEGGDGLRLVMEVRGVSFPDAVRMLLNSPAHERAA